MVNAGRLATATRLATAADSLMGEDPDTYSSVHDSDTIFNTRKEIHAVFVALSDSLRTSRDPSLRAMSEKFRRAPGYSRTATASTARNGTDIIELYPRICG